VLGDSRWRDLLDKHHATIRSNLARFRGHEVKTTGDGFLATFDGPARGFAALVRLLRRLNRSESTFARGCIPASAK
jgi:class 3 adenylate cyclase